MKKFEYKTIKVNTKKGFFVNSLNVERVDNMLNEAGSAGWELVTINDMETGGSSWTFYYTFKREL